MAAARRKGRVAAWAAALAMASASASCDLPAPLSPGQSTPAQGFRTPLPPPPPGTPQLGTVQQVLGPHAFLARGAATTSAQVGDPVYQDDRFFTGSGTDMRIALSRGGALELRENTDPLLRDAQCLFIRLFRTGALYVDGHNICVDSQPNAVIQNSRVVYEVLAPGVLQITVFAGEVRTRVPAGQVVRPGYRLVLDSGRAGTVVPATAAQQRASSAWISTPPPIVRPAGIPVPKVDGPVRPAPPPIG